MEVHWLVENWSDMLRKSLKRFVGPMVNAARRWLTPPEPKIELGSVVIQAGPAKGCEILLPQPSDLATKISGGGYEADSTRVLSKLVKPNDICFDVGGHYGYYSLLLAKLASEGQVHCFEPVEKLAQCIANSAKRSHLPNITVHHAAMAGKVGKLEFRFAESQRLDDSMGFLSDCGGVNTPRSQVQYGQFTCCTVDAVTLDSLSLTDPNFIKLDAEGAEAEILSCGKKLLARAKPRLLIELHGVDLALRCAEILGALGYRGFSIGPRDLMMPVLWLHSSDLAALSVASSDCSMLPVYAPTFDS